MVDDFGDEWLELLAYTIIVDIHTLAALPNYKYFITQYVYLCL